jgi:Mce-associated membrane protein
MNPTLYDILGVSPDASRDEIRKAWREAADRFEPGEGGSTKQFRLFNEAAEVLLDPERRKEYDARLAVEDAPEKPATALPGPPVPGAAGAMTGAAATAVDERDEADRPGDGAAGVATGRRVPWPVLAVLGVLAAVAVGLAAYFVVQARNAEAYQEAVDRAPAAAENAATAVLSYDYKSLDADRDAAAKFLSDRYRKQYVDTFDKLVEKGATETKATVKAQVLASSAMVVGEKRDPDRIPVLLFVNQTTTSSATSEEPSVALNRVRFDMIRSDGGWLVDGITSY